MFVAHSGFFPSTTSFGASFFLPGPIARWQWNGRWWLWPLYLGNYARFFFLHLGGNPYRFDQIAFGQTVTHSLGFPMHLYIGHFWSLCVEEQFYLLWPCVVYQVRKRETLIKICILVIVLSPILRGVLSQFVPTPLLHMELLYRSLPTRLDALLMGALVALSLRGAEVPPGQSLVRRVRRPLLLGSAALFAVLYCIATKVVHLPLEGSASNWIGVFGFTLIDLFAAGLVLACIHPGSVLGRILSAKPLRALGLVSYGFYVYHDLLHDFYALAAHRLFPAHAFFATGGIAFCATLLIANASYRLIEKPCLRLKDHFTSQRHTAPSA